MNRRNFLQLAALAIAGKSAERVFPFRVYSIPKKIVVAPCRWNQLLIPPPRSFDIPPEMIEATMVHVYSTDFKIKRGSFLASINGGSVLGIIPSGIVPGDVLIPEYRPFNTRYVVDAVPNKSALSCWAG